MGGIAWLTNWPYTPRAWLTNWPYTLCAQLKEGVRFFARCIIFKWSSLHSFAKNSIVIEEITGASRILHQAWCRHHFSVCRRAASVTPPWYFSEKCRSLIASCSTVSCHLLFVRVESCSTVSYHLCRVYLSFVPGAPCSTVSCHLSFVPAVSCNTISCHLSFSVWCVMQHCLIPPVVRACCFMQHCLLSPVVRACFVLQHVLMPPVVLWLVSHVCVSQLCDWDGVFVLQRLIIKPYERFMKLTMPWQALNCNRMRNTKQLSWPVGLEQCALSCSNFANKLTINCQVAI